MSAVGPLRDVGGAAGVEPSSHDGGPASPAAAATGATDAQRAARALSGGAAASALQARIEEAAAPKDVAVDKSTDAERRGSAAAREIEAALAANDSHRAADRAVTLAWPLVDSSGLSLDPPLRAVQNPDPAALAAFRCMIETLDRDGKINDFRRAVVAENQDPTWPGGAYGDHFPEEILRPAIWQFIPHGMIASWGA